MRRFMISYLGNSSRTALLNLTNTSPPVTAPETTSPLNASVPTRTPIWNIFPLLAQNTTQIAQNFSLPRSNTFAQNMTESPILASVPLSSLNASSFLPSLPGAALSLHNTSSLNSSLLSIPVVLHNTTKVMEVMDASLHPNISLAAKNTTASHNFTSKANFTLPSVPMTSNAKSSNEYYVQFMTVFASIPLTTQNTTLGNIPAVQNSTLSVALLAPINITMHRNFTTAPVFQSVPLTTQNLTASEKVSTSVPYHVLSVQESSANQNVTFHRFNLTSPNFTFPSLSAVTTTPKSDNLTGLASLALLVQNSSTPLILASNFSISVSNTLSHISSNFTLASNVTESNSNSSVAPILPSVPHIVQTISSQPQNVTNAALHHNETLPAVMVQSLTNPNSSVTPILPSIPHTAQNLTLKPQNLNHSIALEHSTLPILSQNTTHAILSSLSNQNLSLPGILMFYEAHRNSSNVPQESTTDNVTMTVPLNMTLPSISLMVQNSSVPQTLTLPSIPLLVTNNTHVEANTNMTTPNTSSPSTPSPLAYSSVISPILILPAPSPSAVTVTVSPSLNQTSVIQGNASATSSVHENATHSMTGIPSPIEATTSGGPDHLNPGGKPRQGQANFNNPFGF